MFAVCCVVSVSVVVSVCCSFFMFVGWCQPPPSHPSPHCVAAAPGGFQRALYSTACCFLAAGNVASQTGRTPVLDCAGGAVCVGFWPALCMGYVHSTTTLQRTGGSGCLFKHGCTWRFTPCRHPASFPVGLCCTAMCWASSRDSVRDRFGIEDVRRVSFYSLSEAPTKKKLLLLLLLLLLVLLLLLLLLTHRPPRFAQNSSFAEDTLRMAMCAPCHLAQELNELELREARRKQLEDRPAPHQEDMDAAPAFHSPSSSSSSDDEDVGAGAGVGKSGGSADGSEDDASPEPAPVPKSRARSRSRSAPRRRATASAASTAGTQSRSKGKTPARGRSKTPVRRRR